MFDKLVESAKQKQGRRARRLFLATGAIYAVALTALGVATIIGFNSALAEEYGVLSILTPPPVPSGPDPNPAQIKPNLKSAPDPKFVAPKPDVDILPPDQWIKINLDRRPLVDGAPSWTGIGSQVGVPGLSDPKDAPPPPPPTPTPVVKPAATPAPAPKIVSGGVLQGKSIKKVHPPYPPIARAARASGAVSVQVTISEEGRVIEAAVIGGHPLLREAALQAARQWLFQPTELSGVPVKVQGILTFNFSLN
jgi:periplasmic protein TonB